MTKVFTPGEVLTASDVNEFLVNPPPTGTGNAIINGAFDIWQRGTSFTTGGLHTADRWIVSSDSAFTTTQQSFTPAELNLTQFGDANFYMRSVITSGSTVFNAQNRIEDVRTFAGQTVTLSFYAKASTAITLSPQANQRFGSGGSVAVATDFPTVSVGTSWARYTTTLTVPSISGKTLGAASSLAILLRYLGGAAVTIELWGVQLEAGSTATPFKRNANSLQGELAACQRYAIVYGGKSVNERICNGGTPSTTTAYLTLATPVEMRAIPTLSVSNVAHFAVAVLGVAAVEMSTIEISSTESGTKALAISGTFPTNASFGSSKAVALVADNTLDAKLILSAEL